MIHLDRTFEAITEAVRRNDRVLLHEQFARLMTLQDALARKNKHGEHAHTLIDGTMREDSINWPIKVCIACTWWG